MEPELLEEALPLSVESLIQGCDTAREKETGLELCVCMMSVC